MQIFYDVECSFLCTTHLQLFSIIAKPYPWRQPRDPNRMVATV